MKSRFLAPGLAAAFILFLLGFFVKELTPGVHSDATDWAMYVMHARNIVTHHPYTETGYVIQPESTTEVGGDAYPSGFPLILAPFYAAEGFDVHLFKVLNACFLALSLWPAYLFAKRTLSAVSALLIAISLGFSTLFMANFDGIGSDAPYEFISLFVLLFLLRIYDKKLNEQQPWLWGVLAGFSMAAAYLIRPFGVAFLIAVAGVEILGKRRISAFLIACGVVFVPTVLLNNYFFHSDGGYRNQFTLSPAAIVHHAIDYFGFFSYAFANPVSKLYRYAMWAAALVPAVLAVYKRLRAGLGLTELYVFTLLGVEFVYWATNARYLLPIMPIYLVYLFEGVQIIAQRFPQRFASPFKAVAAAALLFAPAANALLVRPDPNDTLVAAPAFDQLCSVIRSQTDKKALVIFWNPRVLALSTGHPASGFPALGRPDDLTPYLVRVHPQYVVWDKNDPDDRKVLIPYLSHPAVSVETVYENPRFRMVRLVDNKR